MQDRPLVLLPSGQPHLCKRPGRLLVQVLPRHLRRRARLNTKPRMHITHWTPPQDQFLSRIWPPTYRY